MKVIRSSRPSTIFITALRSMLLLICLAFSTGSLAQDQVTLEIRPITVGVEMRSMSLMVMPFEQRELSSLSVSSEGLGYTPNIGGLTATWSGPLELTWSFGDGSPSVSTGSHISARHRYEKAGDYTVQVTASDQFGIYGRGQVQIAILEELPSPKFRAVQIASDGLTVQFTGSDAGKPRSSDYKLHYAWDFGDGSRREGDDLWKINHQYKKPGKYKVTLTATDHRGLTKDHKKNLEVAGADQPSETPSAAKMAEIKIPKVVINEFTGNVSGMVSSSLTLEPKPIAYTQYYIVQSKGVCRFKFSFWNDATLTRGYVSFRLNSFKAEGARYRISNPKVSLYFHAKPSSYSQARLAQTGSNGNPGASPFALKEPIGFKSIGGELNILIKPRQHAVGDLNVKMRHYRANRPKPGAVTFDGKFAINLEEIVNAPELTSQDSDDDTTNLVRRRIWQAMQKASDCADTSFKVVRQWPEDQTKHLYQKRPQIRARFNLPVDVDSINSNTFEVGYPDKESKFVKAAGRIMIGKRQAVFVPDSPLLPGVKYQVRIKSGEQGIKSRLGDALEGDNRWTFTTSLDFLTNTDGSSGLACHIYQSIRDPKLIAGKPAVLRVYAKWKPHLNVHHSAQVKRFFTQIAAGPLETPIAITDHLFHRPDLYKLNAISVVKAEHTAQLYFTPKLTDSSSSTIDVYLRLKRHPSKNKLIPLEKHKIGCQMKMWEQKEPELSVDVFIMPPDEATHKRQASGLDTKADRPAIPDYLSTQLVNKTIEAAHQYAMQVYPFRRIKFSAPIRLDPMPLRHSPNNQPLPPDMTDFMCGAVPAGKFADLKFPGYVQALAKRSSADIAIVLGPASVFRGGGKTYYSLVKKPFAIIAMTADPRQGIFDRMVQGVVHEIGHAMGLEHVPYINTPTDQKLTADKRFTGQVFSFLGIEGYRMSFEGNSGWVKSFRDGNGEDESMFPLMYPATLSRKMAFIMDHHYRQLQRFVESGKTSEKTTTGCK